MKPLGCFLVSKHSLSIAQVWKLQRTVSGCDGVNWVNVETEWFCFCLLQKATISGVSRLSLRKVRPDGLYNTRRKPETDEEY